MYLSPRIFRTLDRNSEQFTGFLTERQIQRRLGRILKPYGVRIHTACDSKGFMVSGWFDNDRPTHNVNLTIHLDYRLQGIDFEHGKKGWAHFRFLVSQVAQHELVHKMQQRSRYKNAEEHYYVTTSNKRWKQASMDYLSEFDEIDAYAHDIAMEIKYRYPKKNPYDVVRNIMRHKKLKSLEFYKRVFKDCSDWEQTRTRLFKKIWRWIPQVTV